MSTQVLSDEGISILKTYIQINDDNSSLRNSLFEQLQKTFPNLKKLNLSKKYVCSLICSNFPLPLYEEHMICMKYPQDDLKFVPINERVLLESARQDKKRMKRHRLMTKIYNEIANLYVEFKMIESPVKRAKMNTITPNNNTTLTTTSSSSTSKTTTDSKINTGTNTTTLKQTETQSSRGRKVKLTEISSPEDFNANKRRKTSTPIVPFIKKKMNSELLKMTTTNGLEEVVIRIFKMTPQFKSLITEAKASIENKVNKNDLVSIKKKEMKKPKIKVSANNTSTVDNTSIDSFKNTATDSELNSSNSNIVIDDINSKNKLIIDGINNNNDIVIDNINNNNVIVIDIINNNNDILIDDINNNNEDVINDINNNNVIVIDNINNNNVIAIDDISNKNEININLTANKEKTTSKSINSNSGDNNNDDYEIDHDIIDKSSYVKNCPKTYTLYEAFMKTKDMLHPNMDPQEIDPSRKPQYDFIIKKIQDGISKNQGMTIYACGQPGTGKSMIVTKALQYINEQFPSEDIIRCIFIQGTAVDAQLMYSNIACQLNIIHEISDSNSYANYIKEAVLKMFRPRKSKSKKPTPTTLIFIDEMDMAPTSAIQTLINISNEENSKLMIIGTGNNVIFPYEINLITDPYTLVFKEYKKEDLITILKERCFGGIINQNGITLIATKLLGRQSGDARRAIQILCQCLETVIEKNRERNPDFIKESKETPAKELVKLGDISATLNEIGVGANREPEIVASLSMYCRILVTAMILYDVGLTSQTSRHELKNAYINLLLEMHMETEADSITQTRTDHLIEELYSAGALCGGHSTFGGRMRCFNRDINPHKVEFKLMISPINVLRYPELENVLKRKLELHFKAKGEANHCLFIY